MSAKKTATGIFMQAFSTARTARSPEYRAGVLAHLKYRMGESKLYVCPYDEGSAGFDAFWAGVEEAWNILKLNPGADRL